MLFLLFLGVVVVGWCDDVGLLCMLWLFVNVFVMLERFLVLMFSILVCCVFLVLVVNFGSGVGVFLVWVVFLLFVLVLCVYSFLGL